MFNIFGIGIGKYFKRKLESQCQDKWHIEKNAKVDNDEFSVEALPTDPGLRLPIITYHPNLRDRVRRHYMLKGPCQPKDHSFPFTKFGTKSRRFNRDWFLEYESWLEYSIEKDAAYCICCYLFRSNCGEQSGGDSFVGLGYSNWKKKENFQKHVGGIGSAHNNAWKNYEALKNQDQHIQTILSNHTEVSRSEYRTRLNASVDCVRFLLRQGLAFRGHDESEHSANQGNFLELLKFLCAHNDAIENVSLDKAPENNKLTSPDIQKDIVSAAAAITLDVIIKDIGDALFAVLVDESRDVSMKEQMAIVLRYLNKNGDIIERFVGVEHVASTTALSLKAAIDKLFSKYGLSMSRLRGQGYDGASNMQGEFNGLKALILKQNPSAFYIHCFAHQLQLALVGVAKKQIHIASFFGTISILLNVVGSSSKRCDMLHEKQVVVNDEALKSGDMLSGKGLNQSTTLKRPGETRWSSHYDTLISVIHMFPSIIDVLEKIVDDKLSMEQRCEANSLLDTIQSFEFVFSLHLMRKMLGSTNELSKALQRKDQDIVNAMNLVKIAKTQLQKMRNEEWESLLDNIYSFCKKYNIDIPRMNDRFVMRGRSRRNVEEVTNLHHFKVDIFYAVIDMQLRELNDRFTEVNTELLLCIACLCPRDLFSSFDKGRLICLAKHYPEDFSPIDLLKLDDQLENYICDVRSSMDFSQLGGIGDLAKNMVKTKRNQVYPLVYKLLNLALILPVATATVERAFSAMAIVKSQLRNRMNDKWMNESLIVYIEKDIFDKVENESIMQYFQCMGNRRGQL